MISCVYFSIVLSPLRLWHLTLGFYFPSTNILLELLNATNQKIFHHDLLWAESVCFCSTTYTPSPPPMLKIDQNPSLYGWTDELWLWGSLYFMYEFKPEWWLPRLPAMRPAISTSTYLIIPPLFWFLPASMSFESLALCFSRLSISNFKLSISSLASFSSAALELILGLDDTIDWNDCLLVPAIDGSLVDLSTLPVPLMLEVLIKSFILWQMLLFNYEVPSSTEFGLRSSSTYSIRNLFFWDNILAY